MTSLSYSWTTQALPQMLRHVINKPWN